MAAALRGSVSLSVARKLSPKSFQMVNISAGVAYADRRWRLLGGRRLAISRSAHANGRPIRISRVLGINCGRDSGSSAAHLAEDLPRRLASRVCDGAGPLVYRCQALIAVKCKSVSLGETGVFVAGSTLRASNEAAVLSRGSRRVRGLLEYSHFMRWMKLA